MENRKTIWILTLLLAAVTAGLHALTLSSPPLFDDKLQLTTAQIFTDYQVPFTIWPRWLSYGTFAWTYSAFGEQWALFRLENVLLHTATTISLMLLYRKLFIQIQLEEKTATYTATAGALLFAVHPISVYAVSYLIQRSIIMATLFSVLALYAVTKAVESGKLKWLAWAVLAYLLALSSKEHAVMLPLLAGAMVFLLSRERAEMPLRRVLMYGVVMFLAAALVVAVVYRENIAAPFDETSRELIKAMAVNHPTVGEHAYLLSVLNESFLFFKYLLLWLLPLPSWLSIDMRQPFPTGFAVWPQAMGPILYLAFGLAAAYLIKQGGRRGLAGFGMAVPWLLFPTEFATVWIQDPFVAYRSYLWLIALPAFLPIVYSTLSRAATIALVAVLVAAFGWSAIKKIETFKGEYELWDDAVQYLEQSNKPNVLGKERAYNERASANAQAGRLDEAIADYNKAISINANDSSLYSNRAAIMILKGHIEDAKSDIERALQLDPANPRALYNQVALLLMAGEEDLAMQQLDVMLSKPELATGDAYAARAGLLLKRKQFNQAIKDYSDALSKGIVNAGIYARRGGAKIATGDLQGALADFDRSVELNPASIEMRSNRALLLFQLGKKQEALSEADAAVELDPMQPRAHLVRAQIYVSLNRIEDAIAEYDRILEKNPNEAVARLNRGEVAMALGRMQSARADLEAACKLGLQQGCAKLAALPR